MDNSSILTPAEKVFSPAYYLPAQSYESPEGTQPEKKLLLALLGDAIADYERNKDSKTAYGRHRFEDAKTYLLNPDTSYPFSFINVCYYLNFDPGNVRSAVLNGRIAKIPTALRNGIAQSSMRVTQPQTPPTRLQRRAYRQQYMPVRAAS